MAELRDSKGQEQNDLHENRRRPGRVEYKNAWLIRMLRRPSEDIPDRDVKMSDDNIKPDSEKDDLDPAKGIFTSIFIGTILWVIIIGTIIIVY